MLPKTFLVSTVCNHEIIEQVTSDHVINTFWDALVAIGEVKLGFIKEDIGAHSIRYGAAIAMYLGECPVFMIMLISCWSSNAFLWYICKKVMEFSQNVAKKMLLLCQNFRHIPDIHTRVPTDDPCIQNDPDNAKMRQNVGGDLRCHVRLPSLSQFNRASIIQVLSLKNW